MNASTLLSKKIAFGMSGSLLTIRFRKKRNLAKANATARRLLKVVLIGGHVPTGTVGETDGN